MPASELNRSAPRIQASGSYRFATVKRSAGESGPDESTIDLGATPIMNPVTITSESNATAISRPRTTRFPRPRPVVDQGAAHPGSPDKAQDRPSSRGSHEE